MPVGWRGPLQRGCDQGFRQVNCLVNKGRKWDILVNSGSSHKSYDDYGSRHEIGCGMESKIFAPNRDLDSIRLSGCEYLMHKSCMTIQCGERAATEPSSQGLRIVGAVQRRSAAASIHTRRNHRRGRQRGADQGRAIRTDCFRSA